MEDTKSDKVLSSNGNSRDERAKLYVASLPFVTYRMKKKHKVRKETTRTKSQQLTWI